MVKIRDKRTGEIIEVPDQPGGMQRVGPANPMRPLQVRGAELGNQQKVQDINATSQLLPLQVQKARADAAKAQAEASKANGLDPQKLANIRAAQGQVDRLQSLFMKGPGQTKGFAGVLDYLPTPSNRQFDTAGAGLGEVGLAAFRVPGVGAQSDTELRAFIDANRPSSWDQDAQIKEKLRNLQNRLNATYSAYNMKRQGSQKQSGVIDFNDLPE